MSEEVYWKKRYLLAKQKELVNEADYEAAMRSRLKDMEHEIEKETIHWLTKYAGNNNESLKQAAQYLNSIDTTKWDMTLAEFEAKAKAGGYDKVLNSSYYKSRIARLQLLHSQLEELTAKYVPSEVNHMGIALGKQYKDTYLMDQYHKYLQVGGLDINLQHFNEDQIKQIVYQPWKGSNFSKRIWRNYRKYMPEVLTDVLLRGTLLGYSHNRIESMLRDRFAGIEQKNLHRLVVTEIGHAAEQATDQFYKDSDIDRYQYLAALESKVCDACSALDGKVFRVKDEKEGVNYPVMHPYCRCTTMPYMDNLPPLQSRWYRDPKTGKSKWVNNPMNYKQWKAAIGDNGFDEKKFLAAAAKPSYTPLNETVRKALGEAYSKRIDKVFAKAPVRIQKLYNKFSKQIKLLPFNNRGSYYQPTFNKISFKCSSFDDSWRDNMATYFHEVGHFIDQNSKVGGPTAAATDARQVGSLVKDDWTNDKIEIAMKRVAKEGVPKEDIKPWTNGEKLYYPAYRILRYNKNGSLSKTSLRMVARYEVRKDNIKLANKLRLEAGKNNMHGYTGLSDAICGATGGHLDLGVGHPGAYYSGYQGQIMAGKEFFANYLAAYVQQNGEIERMKKYFPKTSAACEKIIDDTLGN